MQTVPSNPPRTSESEGTLAERYQAVKDRIASAAKRRGRSPDAIVLVAVTKFAAIDDIRGLIELGHVDFGENRVQNLLQRTAQIEDFLQRRAELAADDASLVRWHMIGHLQRNKVRKVIPLVRLLHSVDSLRLAEEIQNVAAKQDEPVEVLIQVNAANEKQKAGVAPAAARHLVDQINTMINVRPRGLMCIAPLVEDESIIRNCFELCQELFDDIQQSPVGGKRFNILSMGMTHDFEIAIECGANMLRIGSGIFGQREVTDGDTESTPG